MTEHGFKAQSPLDELEGLALPHASFMVMGSGILDVLGIRKANDVDLVVSEEVFEQLHMTGWSETVTSTGQVGVERGLIQAYPYWTDHDGVTKRLAELLEHAQWIDGVAYNSLARLSLYKQRRALPKDIADLELIRQYLDSIQ